MLVVDKFCQFLHTPQDQHYQLCKPLLRYIKGTIHFEITNTVGNLKMEACSASDWVGDTLDKKSTTDFFVYLGPTLISWQVKKQKQLKFVYRG